MSPEETKSARLMIELAEGDHRAMRELVELWEAPLLRFAYRYLQSEQEAHEIVQDTFIRLYKTREAYETHRSFAAWLYAIATNLCHNRRRWHRRHALLSLDWLNLSSRNQLKSPHASPDGAVVESERIRTIREAIDTLPHEQKTVILLHEYDDLGYKEIAAALHCNERRVESLLTRARETLRLKLKSLAT